MAEYFVDPGRAPAWEGLNAKAFDEGVTLCSGDVVFIHFRDFKKDIVAWARRLVKSASGERGSILAFYSGDPAPGNKKDVESSVATMLTPVLSVNVWFFWGIGNAFGALDVRKKYLERLRGFTPPTDAELALRVLCEAWTHGPTAEWEAITREFAIHRPVVAEEWLVPFGVPEGTTSLPESAAEVEKMAKVPGLKVPLVSLLEYLTGFPSGDANENETRVRVDAVQKTLPVLKRSAGMGESA